MMHATCTHCGNVVVKSVKFVVTDLEGYESLCRKVTMTCTENCVNWVNKRVKETASTPLYD